MNSVFFAGSWRKQAGPSARIEVVTTASMIPYEVGESYLNAFGKIGCTNIGLMHIRTRQDAMKEEYVERIGQCNAVMFTGGNQLRLSATDGGTEFLSIIKRRYREENFVIAGTSAGAMAMSNTMIYEGNATRAHLKGEVKITTGLDLSTVLLLTRILKKEGDLEDWRRLWRLILLQSASVLEKTRLC